METLDLHNVRHKDVVRKVEDFLSWEDLPVKIITGSKNKEVPAAIAGQSIPPSPIIVGINGGAV